MSIPLLFPEPDLWPADDLWPGWDMPDLVRRALPGVAHMLIAGAGGDENNSFVAGLVEAALAGAERLGIAAWGIPDRPWAGIADPAACADWALDYAAQVTLATRAIPRRQLDETDEEYFTRARERVLYPPQRSAGTERAIRDAARPWLAGTRAMRIVHRVGDEWHFEVRVREDEVLNEAALLAAIDDPEILLAGTKPVLTLVTPGEPWTIGEMEDLYAGRSLAELEADFASIAELEANPGGI